MSTWPYTSRITPMAPSKSEPLRYLKPHHSQGLSRFEARFSLAIMPL